MGSPPSKEYPHPRIVCWIDDKAGNNDKIIKELESKVKVLNFPTTDLFIRYYTEHLVRRSHFSELRIITDMYRIEDGVEMKTAGLKLIKKLRKQNYQHPILIYQGPKSVQRTRDLIQKYEADPNKQLGSVLVESDRDKAFKYASFSEYDSLHENPVSINQEQYDRYKKRFHGRVMKKHYLMRQKDGMGWKYIKRIPNLNLVKWNGIRERLPEKEKEWHSILIRELRHHHHQFWDDELYFKHMEELKDVNIGLLPLYCAIAVRLYTGPELYTFFRDDLKAGRFKFWSYFSAAIETACYYLKPFKGPVWRGTTSLDVFPYHHDMMKNSDFVYVMIGVTSTTTDEDLALERFALKRSETPILYELNVKKGYDISHLSVLPEENEILVPVFSHWRVIDNVMDPYEFRLVNRVKVEQIEECQLTENYEETVK